MKRISGFLLVALALCGAGARATSPVATTVGSNLTAYNNNTGAINNAMWNSYVNPRANSAATAPTADFGNCNAIILRCAQPKCTNGGCSTMEIARPIVSGCVQSNPSCEQYGPDLIKYISAQLVASSTASANQAAADAQVAAAQAAAQQSAQQMAAMQQQMSQMQQQMQQQSADTAARPLQPRRLPMRHLRTRRQSAMLPARCRRRTLLLSRQQQPILPTCPPVRLI